VFDVFLCFFCFVFSFFLFLVFWCVFRFALVLLFLCFCNFCVKPYIFCVVGLVTLDPSHKSTLSMILLKIVSEMHFPAMDRTALWSVERLMHMMSDQAGYCWLAAINTMENRPPCGWQFEAGSERIHALDESKLCNSPSRRCTLRTSHNNSSKR